MKRRVTVVLTFLLLGSIHTALADPPDPPPVPVPNEDVLRPRVPGGGKWFGQVGAGLNLTFMSGNPVFRSLASFEGRTDLFDAASGIGPLIYGAIGYRYSPNFSFRVRLDFDGKRADRSATTIDTCTLTDRQTGLTVNVPADVDKSYEVSVTYLTLSFLPTFHADNLYIFGGPSIGLPLARTVKETDQIVDLASACTYFPFALDSSKVISGSNSTTSNVNTRVAFKLGVGWVIKINDKLDLVPELAFDAGLGDAFSLDGGQFENYAMVNPAAIVPLNAQIVAFNNAIRLNSIQATVGLRFDL